MNSARAASPIALCTFLLLLQLLSACASRPPAPIEDRSRRPAGPASSGVYTVVRGDTLYGIAWRYGLDFRQLAALNAIAEPYVIHPGQALRLHQGADPVPRSVAAAGAATRPGPVVAGAQHSGPAPAERSMPATAARSDSPAGAAKADADAGAGAGAGAAQPSTVRASAPAVAATGEEKRSAPPTPVVPRATAAAPESVADAPVARWQWPIAGPVVRAFSSSLHKGIDIGGPRGDPVRAAAAGRVVYAGSGIAGYGALLIVRHNARYLSAYGHNEQLLVAEGQSVTAGQVIARRGSSGTNSVKLHFEIRRDGQPVNPLSLLPAR